MHHACLAQVMTLAKEDQAAFFTLVATSIAAMIAPATARARGTGTPLPIWRATGYGRPANVQQSGTPCRRAPSRNDRVRLSIGWRERHFDGFWRVERIVFGGWSGSIRPTTN